MILSTVPFMVNVPQVLRVRCHYCQKQRNPREVVRLSARVVICWHCREWHQKAMKAFAGEIPPGCQGCGRSFEDLEAMTPGGDVKFAFVPKDGIYQVLCTLFCSRPYVEKRTELFKGTQFGHDILKV